MKTALLCCLTLFFIQKSWSQTSEDSPRVVVPKGKGLGYVIRTLGQEPNWTNREWVKKIRDANPKKVSESGEVLRENAEIIVPNSALTDLKILDVQIAPTPIAPAPVVENVATQVKPEVKIDIPNHFGRLSAITGIETLNATATSGAESKLNSKAGYGLNAQYFYTKPEHFDLRAQAQWLNLGFESPNGAALQQSDANSFDIAFGIQRAITPRLDLYLDGVFREQNYVQLVSLNDIKVENLWVPGLRLGLGFTVIEREQWQSQLSFSYLHVLGRPSGELQIKDGYDFSMEINILQKRGWGGYLKLSRVDQDSNITDHKSDVGLLGVSYSY